MLRYEGMQKKAEVHNMFVCLKEKIVTIKYNIIIHIIDQRKIYICYMHSLIQKTFQPTHRPKMWHQWYLWLDIIRASYHLDLDSILDCKSNLFHPWAQYHSMDCLLVCQANIMTNEQGHNIHLYCCKNISENKL